MSNRKYTEEFKSEAIKQVVERVKKERIGKRIYRTREEVRSDIFDYIEVFYNRIRRHSYLGQMSPSES